MSYTRKSRKYSSYRGKIGTVAPNRIHRRFDTHIPHQKITTDTSEFKYYEIDEKGHVTMHKLYLDPFMDMCNGEILSYGIDQRPSAKNVMDALDKAIETTADCPYRRTFHSDQGWAYQMKAYSHRLKEERIFQSMSRKRKLSGQFRNGKFLWTAQTRNLLRCCLLQLRGIKIRDRTFYKILQ